MAAIMEPTELAGIPVRNHLVRSATWFGLCPPDGSLTEEICQRYEELARGGVGTIVTELTDVSEWNNAIGNNMRLYSDNLISDYRRLTDLAHSIGAVIMPQLNMNRYARTAAPHMIKSVNAMTADDIRDIRRLFVEAAVRAKKCGFDAVQLHLAYGWLLYRFINPRSNRRKDEYGGGIEGRTRLIREIIADIKRTLPGFPVGAKFSFYSISNQEALALMQGRDEEKIPEIEFYAAEECAEICRLLQDSGLDFIEILGDHSSLERGAAASSCYLALAQAARRRCTLPIILTGGNSDPAEMNRILQNDGIEFFGLSRELIREPNLPSRWASGDLTRAACIHCDGCYETPGHVCRFA